MEILLASKYVNLPTSGQRSEIAWYQCRCCFWRMRRFDDEEERNRGGRDDLYTRQGWKDNRRRKRNLTKWMWTSKMNEHDSIHKRSERRRNESTFLMNFTELLVASAILVVQVYINPATAKLLSNINSERNSTSTTRGDFQYWEVNEVGSVTWNICKCFRGSCD